MTNPRSENPQGGARAPLGALEHGAPLVLYAVYIFISGSSRDSAPPMQGADKTAHGGAVGRRVPFILWALLYFRRKGELRVNVALAMGASSALGALLELWQALLPYRSCEFGDWVADTIGAILAGAVSWAVAATLHARSSRGRA